MEISVGEIARLVGGSVAGDCDAAITCVASVDEAAVGDIVLAEDAKFFTRAIDSAATCILTGLDVDSDARGKSVIGVEHPAEAFIKVLEFFKGEESRPALGIGCGAVVEDGVVLGRDVAIGANCFVGRGANIGDGCILYPNVFVGAGVTIGASSKLYPGAVVYERCKVGRRVVLHAGVVIGADGFGYKPSSHGLLKYPHVGIVEIGEDVEIGANSAIDRAKTGATVIGSGTKIDNLVHIAHNCKIGSHCVIVALSGIAGSVHVGNGVMLAAQVGVKDHVRIEDGAVVAARAGVIGDIEKGATVSGFPAREHRSEMRVQAASRHLPEILTRLRELENEVARLRGSGDCDADERV
ncbi:UDP-3-O-(3-hydroxymyristoyl)glucosamine N-acyltransferase [bacterium]|nr:UDP-3-O-(3-hydroxymyristoyl)glucosamine N-acyltransferase [bacterium]